MYMIQWTNKLFCPSCTHNHSKHLSTSTCISIWHLPMQQKMENRTSNRWCYVP